jgi:glycosyltransferase involved in cell wall biosynthesis
MQSLKILYSAYACEPGRGSEPGIGWHWALETARLGHEVWVLTRANNRVVIEQAADADALPATLHFAYYDLPAWARFWKRKGYGVHLYYILWQWGAARVARTLHARERFTAVHHITFGVMRHPIFMDRLGIPCIVGPVGGGERAPLALRRHYPFGERCKTVLRDGANLFARFDPWVRRMYREASLILAKTPQTLDWLARPYRAKAECMLEIGIAGVSEEAAPRSRAAGQLRMLFVGRFIPFKGMGLGLRALANLRARGIDARLTMIGQGPLLAHWQGLARDVGVADAVTWVPWMSQADLLLAYRDYDLLLFPSLNDSSGNVVLEALANGLPVVCLNLGGPAQIADAACGRVVPVAGKDEAQVVGALADALEEIARDPALAQGLRRGALARARRFAWADVVARIWGPQGRGYRLVQDAARIGPAGAVVPGAAP